MKAEEQVGPKQICMKTALENSIQFVRDQDLKALEDQELKSTRTSRTEFGLQMRSRACYFS